MNSVQSPMPLRTAPAQRSTGCRLGGRVIALLPTLCLLLPSCMVYRGADGTAFASLGTNAKHIQAGGLSVEDMNQSDGLRETGTAAQNLVRLGVQKTLIGAGIKAAQSVTNNAVDAVQTAQ